MKKMINRPGDEVKEMLEGLLLAYPGFVRKMSDWNNLVRPDAPVKGRVALVSGGGSGHEPAHAGYVGKGMLTAACCGEVFTSPSVPQVLAAIKAVDAGVGTLLIIKNYSGDVMNFRAAAQMARAGGIKTEWVIVNDDVAIEKPELRRGVAGTVCVHKCAGAKAEEGGTLEEVKAIAQKTIDNVRSMGCAITSCTVPRAGMPSFELRADEMELGTGIHGERGVKRVKMMTADEAADTLTDACAGDLKLRSGDEVAVLTQGNGGTPYMEKLIFYRGVHRNLIKKGIKIHVSWIGEFMSSLEMAGTSVTLLKLDDELKRLLTASSETLAIRQPGPILF
ncbi:MAG: dihydroxyacetone kinase subunit DhaK [Candidatus Bathyarchaeota archaeon]|nr:dihydroxyacetone kinase subunit DhaK [Candidatus Bathyarchaeota archaeon]